MAQYAAQDGGSRSQSMPFGYDATWLAQQQGQIPLSYSDNFAFAQQHPQNVSAAAGGSILNQTDNTFLGDFFNNPGITDQMDFNFSTMAGADGGEDVKPRMVGEELFDLDDQSGTINPAATALPPQQHNYGGAYQIPTPTQSVVNSQQPSMNSQMHGAHDSHGQDGEDKQDEEEDEEETKAVAHGLMGMSNNRPNPAQMMFGNPNGLGGAWGSIQYGATHNSQFMGMQSAGPFGQGMPGQPHGQAPNGHYTSNIPSHMQGYPINNHMFQQQAYANQARSRHHSLANIRTAGFMHLPQAGPHSALPPNSNYSNPNNSQASLRQPRYGSDDNFGSASYRPSSAYNPEDEKATNLNGVPGAREASVNSQIRQSPMMPPHARAQQAGAQNYQSQYNSSNSQPSTPTFYNHNNQAYLAGLPRTPNGTLMMGNPTYGGAGMGSYPHAHPAPSPGYHQHMQINRALTAARQGHHVEPKEDDEPSSSDSEDSGADSPAPQPTQPARKRRKSAYEQEGEDDYKPSTGGKRRVNSSTLDGSSDEDEYGRPDSSTGKKRARPSTTHRKSTTTPASTPNSQAARTPRPSSAIAGKRSSRKRLSGTHIPRAPLSEEQRRKNHIQSEKNRRDLIKSNYTELHNLVPALKGGKSGLSKSEVLKEIVEFIEELEEGNDEMQGLLDSLPTRFQSKYHDGYSSSDDESDGPGRAASGFNVVQVY